MIVALNLFSDLFLLFLVNKLSVQDGTKLEITKHQKYMSKYRVAFLPTDLNWAARDFKINKWGCLDSQSSPEFSNQM